MSTARLSPEDADGLQSIVVKDAGLQASMQPWFEMECVQLGQGTRLSQVDHLDLGSQQFVRESQYAAIHKLGATRDNLCTVSCCSPSPGSRFSEYSAEAATGLFFMPGNTEFDIYVPAGAITTYVSFDQNEFVGSARALDPAKWEYSQLQLETFPGERQRLFLHEVEEILRQAAAVAAAGNPIEPAVLRDMILQSVLMNTVAADLGKVSPSSGERARAFDICRKARALIAESLAIGLVPTIPQICTIVNVSERTLQYAFRSYVGMTPLAYLRVCRLNCVRKELRAPNPDTTVTAVALRYRFLHLGRFASDYKRLFGVPPSGELARLREAR